MKKKLLSGKHFKAEMLSKVGALSLEYFIEEVNKKYPEIPASIIAKGVTKHKRFKGYHISGVAMRKRMRNMKIKPKYKYGFYTAREWKRQERLVRNFNPKPKKVKIW